MSESAVRKENRVGIELSSEIARAVTIDADGKVVFELSIPFDRKIDPKAGLMNVIDSVRSELGEIEAVCIAVPGLIDRKTGKVAYSAQIPIHAGVDIARELSAETGIPASVENDGNAAAFGEFVFGAGKGSRDMFYATLGYGVGGAMILDGEIWHGDSGFAGEFGYVAINSDGMRLEDVASASNIVRRTRSRFHQDSTSELGKLDEYEIALADILKAASNEDDFALLMLERTGRYVGAAIASVINLLNIETIVIGGPVTLVGEPFLEPLKQRAKELSFALSFERTKIVAGMLGERAAAIGAAILAGRKNGKVNAAS
jgi:glucokinase